MTKRAGVAWAIATAAAVLVAGACGGSTNKAATTTTTSSSTSTTTVTGPLVTVKTSARFGTILADRDSKTLYTLTNAGKAVDCTGACAQVWPPLEAPAGGEVTGAAGLSNLASAAVGGTTVVTYRGLPLYRFSRDATTDDVNGEGIQSFGGTWKVVNVSATAAVTTLAPALRTTLTTVRPSTATTAPLSGSAATSTVVTTPATTATTPTTVPAAITTTTAPSGY